MLTIPTHLRIVTVVPAYGGVAQLVRASACHAEGREFESRRSRLYEATQLPILRRDENAGAVRDEYITKNATRR